MRMVRVLAVIVVTAAVAIGAAHWYLADRQRYTVTLPPASASPEQVVIAYLHALDAHDSSTAEKLVTTHGGIVDPGFWLARTAGLTNIKITGVQFDPNYGPESHTRYSQAYVVDTSFTYQGHWWTDDVSFPDGYHPYWNYWVVRDGGRWLIHDEGTL